MIAIKDVNYFINHKAILQNISIDIPKNQLTALIGPNGAGKSTLLSLISRLIPLQDGQIHIDHMDIKKTKYREMAKKVALFQQNIHLMNRLRVEELLILARFPYHQGWPNTKDKAICETMVDRFSLRKIRHRFLDTLSGGQRQRTLIAMVFCQDTPIILLDEPLNNLDMKHAKELMQSLQDAVEKENKTILLVLHDVNYASKYADYIVAMKNGCIDFYGQTATVLNETNLGNLFNIPVSIKETTEQRLCLYY